MFKSRRRKHRGAPDARHAHARAGFTALASVATVTTLVLTVVGGLLAPSDASTSAKRARHPIRIVIATKTVTATATATATVPGPTATVTVPGPTATVTVPGPTTTVTVSGPTSAPTSGPTSGTTPTGSPVSNPVTAVRGCGHPEQR